MLNLLGKLFSLKTLSSHRIVFVSKPHIKYQQLLPHLLFFEFLINRFLLKSLIEE